MTRVISHLLHKNGIEHFVAGGELVDLKRLKDPQVGAEESCGVTHRWIELGYSYVVDFRARMWMGSEAQHGVFVPAERFEYRVIERFQYEPLSEAILDLMAEVSIGGWMRFSRFTGAAQQ